MTKNEVRVAEQLKDRRDYREALINRRNEIDVKIHRTEAQIKALKESK